MAVESIGNLVQNLTDHLLGQVSAPQAGTRIPGEQVAGTSAATEDTFTPSAQNLSTQRAAETEGIFQLSPRAVTTAASGALSPQAAPNPEQIAPPQGGNASGPDATQAPPSEAAGASSNPSINSSGATGQGAGPAASAEIQNKIQQLNASLPALGLTNNQIQEIDRIASLNKNFNPAAYTDLVNQFEAHSLESAQNRGSASLGSAAVGRPSAADESTSGFQPQQVSGIAANSQPEANNSQAGTDRNASTSPNTNIPPLDAHGAQPNESSASGQSEQAPLHPR